MVSSSPYKSKVKISTDEKIVVCCEKQEESELEEGELEDSTLINASFHEYTFKSTSWVEILEEEEREDMQVLYKTILCVVCVGHIRTELSNARSCICLFYVFSSQFN